MVIATPEFDALDGIDPPVRSQALTDPTAWRENAEEWMVAFPVAGAQIKAIGEAVEGNAQIVEGAATGLLNVTQLTCTTTATITVGQNVAIPQFGFAESLREFRKGMIGNLTYSNDAKQGMTAIITAVDNTAKTMTLFVPADWVFPTATLGAQYSSWQFTYGGPKGVAGNALAMLAPVRKFTGNDTVVSTDRLATLEYTGTGGHTLTVASIATLGASFAAKVKNRAAVGTAPLVLAPAGGALINGRSSILVYPGEDFEINSDATEWRTLGRAYEVLALERDLTGAALAVFEAPFADPETDSVWFEFVDIRAASAAQGMQVQFKNNGAYLTANNYYDVGDDASGGASNYLCGPSSFGVLRFSGKAESCPIGVGMYFHLDFRGYGSFNTNAQVRSTLVWTQALTGPIQGVQFISGTMTGGKIRCYIRRKRG